MPVRRVPIGKAGDALQADAKEASRLLFRNLMAEALEFAYEHAVDTAPVLTGTARWGVNPSMGAPRAVGHTPGTYSRPGKDRLPPRRTIKRGEHGFVAFHAENGSFDYAGIRLEDGYSPKAPQGVIGPTARAVERNSNRILDAAVRQTEREIR